MNMPIAATAGRSRLNAANGQGRGIAAQKKKRSKREISGRAWVVEVKGWRGDGWQPVTVCLTRAWARFGAQAWRQDGKPARVRQYIRQQETRP